MVRVAAPRMTDKVLAVLGGLHRADGAALTVDDVAAGTSVKRETVRDVLGRLEAARWVVRSRREPDRPGPPSWEWRLTAAGEREARSTFTRHQADRPPAGR